jgi:Flp pilus assembly protein TadG
MRHLIFRKREASRALLRDVSGAAAAEFALVLPILIIMTLGTINGSFMLYAYARLHYAAADAARCRAVKTGVCSDDATTASYALSRLAGPLVSPSFSRSTALCGNTVTGTATFNASTGLTTTPITMQARACYPMQP